MVDATGSRPAYVYTPDAVGLPHHALHAYMPVLLYLVTLVLLVYVYVCRSAFCAHGSGLHDCLHAPLPPLPTACLTGWLLHGLRLHCVLIPVLRLVWLFFPFCRTPGYAVTVAVTTRYAHTFRLCRSRLTRGYRTRYFTRVYVLPCGFCTVGLHIRYVTCGRHTRVRCILVATCVYTLVRFHALLVWFLYCLVTLPLRSGGYTLPCGLRTLRAMPHTRTDYCVRTHRTLPGWLHSWFAVIRSGWIL